VLAPEDFKLLEKKKSVQNLIQSQKIFNADLIDQRGGIIPMVPTSVLENVGNINL
jgi:hypothetical protein